MSSNVTRLVNLQREMSMAFSPKILTIEKFKNLVFSASIVAGPTWGESRAPIVTLRSEMPMAFSPKTLTIEKFKNLGFYRMDRVVTHLG